MVRAAKDSSTKLPTLKRTVMVLELIGGIVGLWMLCCYGSGIVEFKSALIPFVAIGVFRAWITVAAFVWSCLLLMQARVNYRDRMIAAKDQRSTTIRKAKFRKVRT